MRTCTQKRVLYPHFIVEKNDPITANSNNIKTDLPKIQDSKKKKHCKGLSFLFCAPEGIKLS